MRILVYLVKRQKALFTRNGERVIELIHGDVCGHIRTMVEGRFYYFIAVTDDFSRYEYGYLLKNTFKSFEKFKEY